MTGSPWKPRAAPAVFALVFLWLLGAGTIASAAHCPGACAGMKTGRELHGDLQVENGIATSTCGCCCCAAGTCCCRIPERPFSDERPAGISPFSTGKSPERYLSAFVGACRSIPQKTYSGPALQVWVSGVGPPVPLFLFNLTLLC